MGGSYMIEALTNTIEAEAKARLAKIDALGGMLSAIEQRYPQGEIENSAFEAQRAVEQETSIVVGVNRHCESSPESTTVLRINPTIEREQVERLAAYKLTRDTARVTAALTRLRDAAAGSEELMPPIVECVRCACTLGEISDTLRRIFGEHKEI